MSNYLLQEDGTSKFVLEDGSGDILLESLGSFPVAFAGSSSLFASIGPSLPVSFTKAGTYQWVCPPGVTTVWVEAYGAGSGGGASTGNSGTGGGGGGAFASSTAVPVTSGVAYTIIVGAGGTVGVDGGESTFTGDSGTQVIAVGGTAPAAGSGQHGTGGQAAACTGDITRSGGDGGTGASGTGQSGAGGGASGDIDGDGASVSGTSSTGATGVNGGGSGGDGGLYSVAGHPGNTPGGGAGGGGGFYDGGTGADGAVELSLYSPDYLAPTFAGTSSLTGSIGGSAIASIVPTFTGTSTLTAAVGGYQLVQPALAGAASLAATLAGMTDGLTVSFDGISQFYIGINTAPIRASIAGTSTLDITVAGYQLTLAGTSSLTFAYDLGPPGARLSQLAVEVATQTVSEARLSQLTLEVARPRSGLHVWWRL